MKRLGLFAGLGTAILLFVALWIFTARPGTHPLFVMGVTALVVSMLAVASVEYYRGCQQEATIREPWDGGENE